MRAIDAALRVRRPLRAPLLDRVLQLLARGELRDPSRHDLDRGARLGVAYGASPSSSHRERAETHQRDLLALLERLGDVVEERVDGPERVGLREARVPGHPRDDLGLVHGDVSYWISNGISWVTSFFATLSVILRSAVYLPGSYFSSGTGPTTVPPIGASNVWSGAFATGSVLPTFWIFRLATTCGLPVDWSTWAS